MVGGICRDLEGNFQKEAGPVIQIDPLSPPLPVGQPASSFSESAAKILHSCFSEILNPPHFPHHHLPLIEWGQT